MSDWLLVGPESLLAEGEHMTLEVAGDEVALFRTDGTVYAIADVCSHDGAEIAIVCPRHGAKFCLATGKALCAPAYTDIAAYEVRIVDGHIEVATTPKP